MPDGRAATITGNPREHKCRSSCIEAHLRDWTMIPDEAATSHLEKSAGGVIGWHLADVHCRRTDAFRPDDASDDPPGREDAAELLQRVPSPTKP
jgi:hypothetical protein